MGGFPHYGVVKNDYLMLKGCTVGIRKRTLMLRKGLFAKVESGESAAINLKFIDTLNLVMVDSKLVMRKRNFMVNLKRELKKYLKNIYIYKKINKLKLKNKIIFKL